MIARTCPASAKTPAEQRAFLIYYARVLLREARARRGRHRGFAASLIEWAGRSRREAAAIDTQPAQADLFDGPN